MQSDGLNNSGGSALYSLRRGTCVAAIAIYPVLHVAAVWLGLFLSAGTQTATLWTSNALLLAVMVILGQRWWAPLLISLLAAEAFTIVFLTSDLPLSVALHFSAANILEATLAAVLWQKIVKGPINIFRLRDCILLVFVVAVAAPAIGGLLAGFGQSGTAGSPGFFKFWQLWWLANLLGILVITTTILAWVSVSRDDWRLMGSRRYELAALVVLVTGLTFWVFGSEPGSIGIVLGLPHIVFPLLIWSAVRFGTRVSMALVLLIAMVSVIYTDNGFGPYGIPSYTVYQRVLSLQMFLTAAAISALMLGAAFSERRVALHFLRESEDKFSKAFHGSPDAICIFRVSDGRITDVNDSFYELTGHAPSESVGATLEQLNLLPLEEQRQKCLARGNTDWQLVRLFSFVTSKSGSTRECETAYDIAEIGGDLCMVCVLHDLSRIRAEEDKRLELEAQLMQARKMEAIGQLTGGIAHDFNNILSGMLGYAELAEDRAARMQDSVLTNQLREIRGGGTRARDLVAQLLTFSRKRPTNPVPINALESIDEVLRLLRHNLPASLDVNASESVPDLKVFADPVQLQQLIMNLYVNARDATGGRGVIDITVDEQKQFHGRCSSCQQQFDGDFTCVSVRDSGPGIAAESVAKIFEPFYSSKKDGEGTGLGMSVVHGVVHQHDGHIVVDGTAGKTTVSAYFPRLVTGASGVVPQHDKTSRAGRPDSLEGNVLLVDDEDAVRNVMTQALERQGLVVTAERNGADALSRFAADPLGFDLVITDQTMPEMTGVILAEKMLAIRPDLPVILCSGFSQDIDEKQALELGIRGFYQKPFDFSSFMRQVTELLAS